MEDSKINLIPTFEKDVESQDDVIRIIDVKKQYRLGAIGGGTLREDLQSWWARIRGKEDPNLKIGATKHAKGDKFYALNGVSFNVRKQERVGIIGRNGAGKSTLLKILSRVTAPTEGELYIKGRIASMLEVGTGFHDELTGRENVYMNGSILGMTKAEIDSKMNDIIEFSEIGQFIDTPAKRYSSGMYVKLAFSVAAHLNSEIMIMDEVLAVGDMNFQNKCLQKMRDVAINEGKTILYVSHNMATIRELCDRCIVLSHGEIIYNGDVETAIGVYLGNDGTGELSPHHDYTELPREVKKSLEFEILSFDVKDKEVCRFKRGEKMAFNIRGRANADFENFKLRFEVRTMSGVRVGATLLDRNYSAKKGDVLNIEATFDTKELVAGMYAVNIAPFRFSDSKGHVAVDYIKNAFCFEIYEDENVEFIWPVKNWGSVKLKELNCTEISVK